MFKRVSVATASVLLFVAFGLFAAGQDNVIKFRGVYIGESVTDLVDCSSNKPKREGYKVHGKVCQQKGGLILHEKVHGFVNPKEEGERIKIEDGKVAVITIHVPNEDWEKVKYDLTEKLGEPISDAPQLYQNGFGARWEFDQGFWQKGALVAAAGVKVLPVHAVLSNGPATEGIQITIMSAERAKLPSTTPNTLD
jgi:hypothetical protein